MNVRSPGIVVVAILCLNFRCDLGALEAEPRSVSPSGQFIIYGRDAEFRGSISALAEKAKSDLLSILQQRDAWKIPIVIGMQRRAVNLPDVPDTDLRFIQTDEGLKLQLDVNVSRDFGAAAIERELARVILLEMIYRNQTTLIAGEKFCDVPTWLIEGLLASAPNRDRASFTVNLPVMKVVPLREFLRQQPESLDSAGKELYRAYSFVLVQLLLESQNGRVGIRRYVNSLALGSNDPLSDLQAAFPAILELEKSWRSKITEVKSAKQGLFTFVQTEERLQRILENSVRFDRLPRTKLSPSQHLALRKLDEELLLLATRANPVLRPVIFEYRQITGLLMTGESRMAAARLIDLKNLQTKLSARMREIDDYLNWFEAAKLETPSGLFENDLKRSSDEHRQAPRRTDPLSVYLDAVENEF